MTAALQEVAGTLALLVTAAALLAGLVALAATRCPAAALPVFLDLLVAAGLLRLVGEPGGQTLAATAAIVLLRRLIGSGLHRRADLDLDAARPGPGDRTPDLRRLLRPAWRG